MRGSKKRRSSDFPVVHLQPLGHLSTEYEQALGYLALLFKDISMGHFDDVFARCLDNLSQGFIRGKDETRSRRTSRDRHSFRSSRLEFGLTGCGESCSLKAAFYPSLTSLSSRNIVGPQSGRRGAESMRSHASFSRGASRNDKLLARTTPPRFAKIT